MSEKKLNISRQTNALLRRLGLEPSLVKELHLTPTMATATVYKRNEEGAKYLRPDTGLPATKKIKLEVRT